MTDTRIHLDPRALTRLRANRRSEKRPVRVALVGALSALSLAVTLGGGACSHPSAEPRRLPAWVFAGSHADSASTRPRQARPRGGIRGRSEASDFVVAALQDAGLRFGTDGSVAALWGYLASSHIPVAPAAARPGDVLFFQTRVPASARPGTGCDTPDHVGIVSTVDPDGRIGFVEARDRQVRRSYVDPEHPRLRRDGADRVMNSFLRPKRIDDPPDMPAFAGEMLCAAVRART
jgi:hypothetical protein